MSKKFIRHHKMKNDTLTEILNAISKGAACKREVQSHTGLSWGKTSEIVNLLLKKQIINFSNDIDRDSTGSGRKSSYFEFSRTSFICMGMELQRHRIITTLINIGGKIIGQNSKLLASSLTLNNLRQNVHDAFEEQLEKSSISEEKVIALSFSLTGAVDSINQVWLQSTHVPDIKNYDFSAVADDFPHLIHFSIEHDIQTRARSVLSNEKWLDDNFVFMHIGGGVGMAIYTQGGFFCGSRGLAGEIGHIPVINVRADTSGRQCSCGQHNCLETFLSDHGLLFFANEEFGIEANDLSTLFSVATQENMDAFYNYIQSYLLNTCITASNLFDPATLIIGGELLEPWLPKLQKDLSPKLQALSWLHSPKQLKCYRMNSCDSSFGVTINAIQPVISKLAAEISIRLKQKKNKN